MSPVGGLSWGEEGGKRGSECCHEELHLVKAGGGIELGDDGDDASRLASAASARSVVQQPATIIGIQFFCCSCGKGSSGVALIKKPDLGDDSGES